MCCQKYGLRLSHFKVRTAPYEGSTTILKSCKPLIKSACFYQRMFRNLLCPNITNLGYFCFVIFIIFEIFRITLLKSIDFEMSRCS